MAHAGEEGPPDYIVSAIDRLHVERIDHGVRSIEDVALMQRLAQSRVPLTVCPLSNLKLRVVKRMEDHPLLRLLDAGLAVMVNSDDPAYFGGYLNDNYIACFDALPLTREHARQLARNSFEAAFVDAAVKREYLERVDAYFSVAG